MGILINQILFGPDMGGGGGGGHWVWDYYVQFGGIDLTRIT